MRTGHDAIIQESPPKPPGTRIHVVKHVEIHASHHLPWHKGQCKKVHGHTYNISMFCHVNKLGENGIVADFGELAGIAKQYDHENLNDHMENPTTELLAEKIALEINERYCCNMVEVIISESASSRAVYIIDNCK